MRDRPSMRRLLPMFAGVIIATSAWAVPASAGEADLPGHFEGDAWGNHANAVAGEIATRMGRSAFQPCPCLGTDGEIISNNVHGVRAGDDYRADELISTAQAQKQTGMQAFVRMTSRVVGLRALDGLITADMVDAVVTARATASTLRTGTAGSGFIGLRVNGVSIDVSPGARIRLAGFGHVTLMDISRFGDGVTTRGVQVEMLRIVITRNNPLEIPIGAVLVIGHARAAYDRDVPGAFIGAAAWGSQATSSVPNIENRLGRSAAVYLGCRASGSSTKSNQVNRTVVPGILTTGLVRSTVGGEVTGDSGSVSARSRLVDVVLLGGVLTADLIVAEAEAMVDGSGGQASFDGSRFVDLRILGLAVDEDVPPNTQIPIPGLGQVTLYSTTAASDADLAHASVVMVVVEVTVPNSFGIPVGTKIRLARARANAAR